MLGTALLTLGQTLLPASAAGAHLQHSISLEANSSALLPCTCSTQSHNNAFNAV